MDERVGSRRRRRGRSGQPGYEGNEEIEDGNDHDLDKESLPQPTLPSDEEVMAMRAKLLLRSPNYIQPEGFDAECGPLPLYLLVDAAGSDEDDAGNRQRQRQWQQRREEVQNLLARIQDVFRIPRAQPLYDAFYYGREEGYIEVCPDLLD